MDQLKVKTKRNHRHPGKYLCLSLDLDKLNIYTKDQNQFIQSISKMLNEALNYFLKRYRTEAHISAAQEEELIDKEHGWVALDRVMRFIQRERGEFHVFLSILHYDAAFNYHLFAHILGEFDQIDAFTTMQDSHISVPINTLYSCGGIKRVAASGQF
ncbi:hypothetical protein AX16_003011 [Volvariella volvacea WC 439]|nr:hypothetical protein AX16_003011 [Volvariella volvacea WC 439]